MELLQSLAQAEQYIFSKVGRSIHLATPLGLGKPNQLLNLIYERAERDPDVRLKIFTALSLDFADPKNNLEARFLKPFYLRQFGENYPHLKYVRDMQKNDLPKNISVHEFYFQAGAMVLSEQAQSAYISLNYTHVARAILQHDINVIVQLISKSSDGRYSLSCNPDLTLDVADLYKNKNKELLVIGVIHPDLPFLGGDAEVDKSFFSAIVETSEVTHTLFGLPKTSEDEFEHMIGYYASQLIEDDGTLQIGIGSLSDALVYSVLLRHQNNVLYEKIFKDLWRGRKAPAHGLETGPFYKGLYGTSEMIMDGFMHLREAGILKREILDHNESAKRYLHGAFFLGSKDFYKWLNDLSPIDYDGLAMTRVSKVNDLYDSHEMALRRQRKKARFFNTCMSVSLLGAAASDTLGTGQVVSGVGGQYNFVAMSHELEGAHSVLMLRSTREKKGRRYSNIVTDLGPATIPRHLRDIVITEYGVAFLKGETDETVIQRLIEISDSEFQPELLSWAKKNGKIAQNYQIPESARNNSPKKIKEFIKSYDGLFPLYPFGSDFTDEEISLGKGLLRLKGAGAAAKIAMLGRGLLASPQKFETELARLSLSRPSSVIEFIYQKLVLGSLT